MLFTVPCFIQREKLGTHERVPEIYTNIYHLYMGCIMVLWDNMVFHVLGTTAIRYLPKGGPQNFPNFRLLEVNFLQAPFHQFLPLPPTNSSSSVSATFLASEILQAPGGGSWVVGSFRPLKVANVPPRCVLDRWFMSPVRIVRKN